MKPMFLSAALVALGLGTAHADVMSQQIVAGQVHPAVITVTGDGQGYHGVNAANGLLYKVRLAYDTGVAGRIKSWRVQPLVAIDGTWMNPFFLTTFEKTQSYPIGNRPKKIDEQIVLGTTNSFLTSPVRKACNDRLQARLDGGMNVVQAYAAGDEIPIQVDMQAEVDANGPGSNNPTVHVEPSYGVKGSVIHCMPIKITPSAPDELSKAPNGPGKPDVGKQPTKGTLTPQRPGREPGTAGRGLVLKAEPLRPRSGN